MAAPKPIEKSAPSLDYLLDLRDELQLGFKQDDEQIKRMREVRELQRAVDLPARNKLVNIEVRDPTIADEAFRVPATIGLNGAKCKVTPSKQTDAAQANATLRERWSEAVFDEAGGRAAGPAAFDRLLDHCCNDGAGWLKVLYNRDLWDERYSIKPAQFSKLVGDDPAGSDDADEPDDPASPDEPEPTPDGGPAPPAPEPYDVLALPKKKPKRVRITDWGQYNDAVDEAKKTRTPFEIVSVDPLTIYPLLQGRTYGEVLEVSERPRSATFRKYRLETDAKGRLRRRLAADDVRSEELGQRQPVGKAPGSAKVVTFLEHWDDVYVSYAVLTTDSKGSDSGEIVRQWKHGYPGLPYFWAPALMMGHWANRKTGWGISESKRWLVEYRSYLWTVHAQVCARDAFTPVFRRVASDAPLPIGSDMAPTKDESWTLGTIYTGKPGETFEPLKFPPVAQALREEIAIVSEAIERLESPRVKGDIGSGVEGAGFAINSLLSEAKTRFAPIQRSIEKCLEEATRFLWRLVVSKVGESVWVYREGDAEAGWIKAGPEDLTESVQLRWTLNPEQPSAGLIKNRLATERLQNGTWNLDAAIDFMGDNPDEVRQGQAMDRIRSSPWYQNYLERYILSKAARGDLLKQAADAEQMAKSGAVPAGGPGPGGMGQGAPGQPPGGGPNTPDMGALATSPFGRGAAPAGGPGNGSVSGAGPGAVMPMAGTQAGPGLQRL